MDFKALAELLRHLELIEPGLDVMVLFRDEAWQAILGDDESSALLAESYRKTHDHVPTTVEAKNDRSHQTRYDGREWKIVSLTLIHCITGNASFLPCYVYWTIRWKALITRSEECKLLFGTRTDDVWVYYHCIFFRSRLETVISTASTAAA